MIHHDPRVAPKFPRPGERSIENIDIHTILSHFDEVIGPKTEIIIPPPHGRLEKDKLQSIPKFLDLVGANPGEPFIHSMSDYGSINLMFSVQNESARGGFMDFMLSVAISPPEIREMIKITQLGALLRAVAGEISNHYRLAKSKKELHMIAEPQEILTELLEEIQIYLRTS